MALFCELNDSEVLLIQEGQIIQRSPAYISIEGKQAYVGQAGHARVKLKPTDTYYHFWERLGLERLEPDNALAQTQADLAFLHLSELAADLNGEVVLVVPGDMTREQLGLLLGMTRRLQIQVRAMVDVAVIHSAAPLPGQRLFHLDCHLHRCVLTELEQGPWLTRGAVESSHEMGLVRLWEAWLHGIAALFVQATRFDPMHEAWAEQSLFDRLGEWIGALDQQQHVDIEVGQGQRHYAARLHRKQLIAAAQPLYRRLRDFVAKNLPVGQAVTLQVTARTAALPGLVSLLETLPDTQITILATHACEAGVQRLYLKREQSELETPYVTRLPWFSANDAEQHLGMLGAYQRVRPTHVVHQAIAYPLANGEFWVGAQLGQVKGIELASLAPTVAPKHFRLLLENDEVVLECADKETALVNGEVVRSRRPVMVGDKVRLGNPATELLIIAVADDGT